ncbi:hypothetical protein P9112_005794 [Eukaryota sp. TZLM1-RC]
MYFFCSVANDGIEYTIYSGRDKIENETLIRYAWDVDWWFHVSEMSSAHIYLRLPDDKTIDQVPQEVIQDCAQLTKANSIKGNKTNNVRIVFTPASNLLKESHMVAGQVSFKDPSLNRYITIECRNNSIVNRLNKTRIEEFPNLCVQLENRINLLDQKKRRERLLERKKQEELVKKQREENELRSYSSIMALTSTTFTNKDFVGKSLDEVEDDFM